MPQGGLGALCRQVALCWDRGEDALQNILPPRHEGKREALRSSPKRSLGTTVGA